MLGLIPSLALVLVWASNAYSLLADGMELNRQAELGRSLDPKLDAVRWNVEKEMRVSSAWLADSEASHGSLKSQRNRTDSSIEALGDLRQKLEDAPENVRAAQIPFADVLRKFPLSQLRTQIDRRAVEPLEVMQSFNSLIGAEITALFEARQVPQGSLVSKAQPLSMLTITSQAIHLEDTVMAQALVSGTMRPAERVAFMTPLGLQRSMLADLEGIQSPSEQAALDRLTKSAAWKRMAATEDAVLAARTDERGRMKLPPTAAQWRSDLDTLERGLEDLIRERTDRLLASQTDTAHDTLRHEGVVTLAGLAAVIVSATLSWRVARSLLRRMAGLRAATLELAQKRLPAIVERLNRGEKVEVESEALDLDYGSDQVGQVAQAFNAVQRTGIHSAVALADARRGFQKAILISARRSQNLVNGQLAFLDDLERKYENPGVLKDLYQLDSQATQLRRYEDNLLIISDSRPARHWNEPVPLADVLRSAVGEVAEYQRITVSAEDQVSLVGRAVGDVVHLLAELTENATRFSPPVCPVLVRGDTVGKGVAVEIEDRGVGMSEAEYASANLRLADPPPLDVLSLGDDARLGLFVIARLANRLGITVTLRPSVFGGTSAVVLIPEALLVRQPEQKDDRSEAPANGEARGTGLSPSPRGGSSGKQTPASVPTAPVALASAATAVRAASKNPDASGGPPPPLPERVPQASLAQELRQTPETETREGPAQQPPATAQRAAHSLSAFQRGSTQARKSGPAGDHGPGR
ncbi:nitrate- and nitrite sensing domain-containing protein [Streptomyces sp. NPDC051776]|uniref:sensor histidine kinase n=1 Tax=Streptomyces sp. NPDC051776 TaxID=3155414 RepID=UPI003449A023